MNVDEMDLAGQALEVTPWRSEEYERARATLRGAMAESGSLTEAAPMPAVVPLRGTGSSLPGHRRRRTLGTRGKVGIGAGIGAIAAAAALVLAATPAPQSAPSTAQSATTAGSAAQPSGGPASPAGSADARSPLLKLAADVVAERRPAGDATLVERETGAPGHASINVWDLYTDDGRYFFSQTEAGLPAQVRKDNNQGDGQFGREVAAAAYAATGDLDTALLKMAWPFATPAPAWLSAQVKNMPASAKVGGILPNWVWENCEDALVAGSGNPRVRAGVLRLVSALPGITVTHGTVDGQPTLTLAAGKAEFGNTGPKNNPKAKGEGEGPARQEAITVNAHTSIPLEVAVSSAGKSVGTITYVVTRVNLTDIAAGKF